MFDVAVVGLGYVGLPLAVALGKSMPTLGVDINTQRIENLKNNIDPNGDLSSDEMESAILLSYTNNPNIIRNASIIIIAVPTPIDDSYAPDLEPLKAATKMVGENMQPNAIVIFESTVYPGCTEEVCVPILEEASDYVWANNATVDDQEKPYFYVGYSPERINPGDKDHRLENTTKVVAGDCEKSLEVIAELYESIVEVGVHRAPSITVAEAAKVIENSQRDLNIAFMNELAIIFNNLGIDTMDVLEAAGTKWNFLPFRPGLVGGHCIGVDPYYLTYKSRTAGYDPRVILAGRDTNDGMGQFIAQQTIKQLAKNRHPVSGANVTILGLTFKEDCADLRNSRVGDIIKELEEYGCNVTVHDPVADPIEAKKEYGVDLVTDIYELLPAHAVILAVGHKNYKRMLSEEAFEYLLDFDGVVMDIKSMLDRDKFKYTNIWRL